MNNAENKAPEKTIESTSDQRVVNNVLRHEYKVLSDEEKAEMKALKDAGQNFLDHIATVAARTGNSRELSLAITKVEEAVMWSVKHVTK